jgi:hypothetical protein
MSCTAARRAPSRSLASWLIETWLYRAPFLRAIAFSDALDDVAAVSREIDRIERADWPGRPATDYRASCSNLAWQPGAGAMTKHSMPPNAACSLQDPAVPCRAVPCRAVPCRAVPCEGLGRALHE